MAKDKEVVKTEAAGALMTPGDVQAMMAEAGVSAKDISVPKLLLMQNTSDYVGEGTAKLGDIVNSSTLQVVGGFDAPLEIIPLMKVQDTWRIYDMGGKTPKFMRMELVTPENENKPWEDNEGGTPIRRDKCFNFFALIASEVDAGEEFPVALSFKRTSMKAGETLATIMYMKTVQGKRGYAGTVILAPRKEKADSNTYSKYECKKGVPSKPAYIARAEWWVGVLKAKQVTVDETVEEKADAIVTPAPAPSAPKGPSTDIY